MPRSADHYKRLRMQRDLCLALESPVLPDGYRFVPWQPIVQDRHAQVQWRSFRDDLDGRLFSCLRNLQGCRRLLQDTVHHLQFAESATWLVVFCPEPEWPPVDCAMIQGLARPGSTGAIQNVGVVPEHRGFGLGRAVLLQALHGFRQQGVRRATLEVTAGNQAAVNLYQSLGFEVSRVLYRQAEVGSVVDGSERAPLARELRTQAIG
jgi:GNAT superfamily N-acetyltransferase